MLIGLPGGTVGHTDMSIAKEFVEAMIPIVKEKKFAKQPVVIVVSAF